jgi:predicted membrane channel-forming protein YqfA (hemolysin III family)
MSNLKYFLAFCKSIYDTTPWAGTAINIWHMNMCKCWLVSTCRNRHLFPKQ